MNVAENQPTYSNVNRELIATISGRVGEKVVSWANDEEVRTGQRVAPQSKRAYAANLVRVELESVDRERLARTGKLMPESESTLILREVMARLFGLGGLQAVFDRRDWTDLFLHGVDATLRLTNGSKLRLGAIARNEEEVQELIRQLAATSGRTARQFNQTNPMLSMRLPTGERLSACIGVSDAIEVAIRRQTLKDLSLDELCERGSMTPLARDFLRVMVKLRRNVVVSGPTGGGKTTMLAALAGEISFDERIITIEDAAELNLRSEDRPDVVSLESREANTEGVGAITMDDLAKQALRMSPDRVICGEVRGVEVAAMLSAMSQGNDGSMCTVHSQPGKAMERLRMYLSRAYTQASMPSLTDTVAQAVHFVVAVGILRDGSRRTLSIREVTGSDGEVFMSNEVFAFDGRRLVATGALSEEHRVSFSDLGFPVHELGGRR